MIKPTAAHMRIKVALKKGEIIRPEICEVCGSTLEDRENENEWRKEWMKDWFDYHSTPFEDEFRERHRLIEVNRAWRWCNVRTFLVAHHWRGYDYPLDVWWVCSSCNRNLIKHDGSVTLEQARSGQGRM